MKKRPKIVVFIYQFGTGHQMAGEAIRESLPNADVEFIDIYDTVLSHLDLFTPISKKLSSLNIYNWLLQRQFYRVLNLLFAKLAPKIMQSNRKKTAELLKELLKEVNPDLLISCIPNINADILSVTKQLNIPFLVIPTDIDISVFCNGFQNHSIFEDRKKFRIAIAYPQQFWDEHFGKKFSESLRHSFQYGFGYPLRKGFNTTIEPETLNQIRKEYHIQPNEALLLIMMGGKASRDAENYIKLLLQMSDAQLDQIVGSAGRLHVLSLNQIQKTNQQLIHPRIRIQIRPFTPKIAELTSLPELRAVITKPGGVTVSELIKKQIPAIYHLANPPILWEEGNAAYGTMRGFGTRFYEPGNVSLLAKALTITFHQERTFPEASLNFTKSLQKTVEEML